MNGELTFRVIAGTLLILVASMRVYYGLRVYSARKAFGEKISPRERLKESAEREGRLIMVPRLISSSLFFAVVFIYILYPQWVAGFKLPLSEWSRWIGVGLGISSLPLFLWVHHALGKYFSPELTLKEQHKLVTGGPYRWVRHPMYSVHFVFFIALSFMSANWLIVLSGVATIIMIYARIGREEAMMIEQFGDEYRDYMKRTGRLLPRLSRKVDKARVAGSSDAPVAHQ